MGLESILKDYALGRIYKLCSMVWGLVAVLRLLVGLGFCFVFSLVEL
jgi:hypothetical protein